MKATTSPRGRYSFISHVPLNIVPRHTWIHEVVGPRTGPSTRTDGVGLALELYRPDKSQRLDCRVSHPLRPSEDPDGISKVFCMAGQSLAEGRR